MGCGHSAQRRESAAKAAKARKQSVIEPTPFIHMTVEANVKFVPRPATKSIVIIGEV